MTERAKELAQRIVGLSTPPYDPESDHFYCDKLLIEILREYGHTEAADAFENMERWYA